MSWGGGFRVLMTYLQWRFSDGLARPHVRPKIAVKSNKIIEEATEGGMAEEEEGGFAAAEALHSNGRVVWSEPPCPHHHHCHHHQVLLPSPPPPPSPPSAPAPPGPQRGGGREGRVEEVLSGSRSQRVVLFLNTKCGGGPQK